MRSATANYGGGGGGGGGGTFNLGFHHSGVSTTTTKQPRQRPVGIHTNPIHWSLHNGMMYYGDSDDDSGIGHSNNGGGGGGGSAGFGIGGGSGGQERVGSTSSAEAEVTTPTETETTSKEVRSSYARSRNIPFPQPRMGRIQLEQQRRTFGKRTETNFYPLRDFRPPQPPMDSLESSDEVFHSFCAWLDRKRPITNGGTVSRCCTNGKFHKVLPLPSRNYVERPNTELTYGRIGAMNLSSHRVPPPPLPIRNYEGDSSRYANLYENMFRDQVLRGDQTRMRPLSLSATNEASVSYSRPPPPPSSQPRVLVYSDRDSEPGRLQRARSTSLASLITIDSDMVRVHACPAAVIPASEAGDSTLNESFCSRNGGGGGGLIVPVPLPPHPPSRLKMPITVPYRNFPGCYESIASNDEDEIQPPLPPRSSSSSTRDVAVVRYPSPASSSSRPSSSSVKQIPITLPHPPPLVHSSPKDSQRNGSESNGGFKEVEYAQVIKPKKKSAKNGSVCKETIEESEPPLPPRNYRSRHLTRNGRNSSSRSSFTERVQDFTRSAKQALRKAFSLDGLNRRPSMDRSSLASRDWDVDSEWGERRRNPPKPRTPAEVKARDADRDRRYAGSDHRSNRKLVSVTLC